MVKTRRYRLRRSSRIYGFKNEIKIRRKFPFRLAPRASLVIKSERVAICKKLLVATLFCAFAFGVYMIWFYLFFGR